MYSFHGFENFEYEEAGATILQTIEEIYAIAEMILKVKEPIELEYNLIKEGQLLFTYFHFASSEPLTKAMIKQKAVCLAYETVEKEDRSLPLLVPMSEVAGRMAVQQGAKYLEKPLKGKGVLLGGVPGVRPGDATAEYFATIATRITFFGALFLGLIAVLPMVLLSTTGNSAIAIGGTGVLIAVSVVLDLIKKLDAQIAMREY